MALETIVRPTLVPRTAHHTAIRVAEPDDWRDCGRICYEAFATVARRHGFPPDFPSVIDAAEPIRGLIADPHIHGVVAEQNGVVVGSAFMDERSLISAIGPVSVDPAVQDAGVGRRLMESLLERAAERRAPGVRLVQISYHNRSLSLYAKLGFDVRATMAAMHGDVAPFELPGSLVRLACRDDLDACDALCLRVHGFARSAELSCAVEHGRAFVVERLGRITAYSCGVEYWSHSVAETNDDLMALVCEVGRIEPPGILVPLDNAELFRWCLERGLRVFFVTNLMALGIFQQPRSPYLPSVGY